MKIITISGLDGSGKSTQRELLQKHLESLGNTVHYFHAVQFSLAAKFSGKSTENPGESKGIISSNRFLVLLREFLLLADILRFRCERKKLERKKCDFIVSDRYFYDTLIHIAYLKQKTELRVSFFIRLALCLLPKPNFAFFLNISPKEIMHRKHAPEQGEQYLKNKHPLYTSAISLFNFTEINGNQTADSIFEEIRKIIMQ